jgi:dTDP-4-amino-4,6-dideoxygalactose transaminase
LADGKLTPKVIVAVDLFGLPANYPLVKAVAQKYNLLILEDGAQGFGGSINGQRACSFGDIATTSFFPAKPLGCYGDGGAVFTNNDEWAQLMNSYRVHGKGTDKYDNVRIGMNSRLDTLQATILQVKLRAFDKEVELVNEAARQYTELLKDHVNTPIIPEGFGSSWAQYTIKLSVPSGNGTFNREALQAKLKAKGVPSMVYYPTPMSKQTAFKEVHQYVLTPNAQQISDCVLSLPMHPYITREEIRFVAESLISSL